MAKKRFARFYRNSNIIESQVGIQDALDTVMTGMKQNASALKDGELMLGRYSYPYNSGGATTTRYGVLVGIARERNNQIELDFLYDMNAIEHMLQSMETRGGEGVSVSTSTIGGVSISTVDVDLSEKAHVIGSTNYSVDTSNILLIGSDGKLTIEDTWDCGTY